MMGIDEDLAKLAQMGNAEDSRMLAACEALRLADLVRHLRRLVERKWSNR